MVIRHIVVNTVGPKYAYVQQRYARIFVHISKFRKTPSLLHFSPKFYTVHLFRLSFGHNWLAVTQSRVFAIPVQSLLYWICTSFALCILRSKTKSTIIFSLIMPKQILELIVRQSLWDVREWYLHSSPLILFSWYKALKPPLSSFGCQRSPNVEATRGDDDNRH